MAGIGDAIFSILSGDATLTTALGASSSTAGMKKIYPNVAPQTETAPWLTYSVYASPPDHSAQGRKVQRHYIQIDAWATSPDTAATLSSRIITLLDGYAGTVAGFQIDNILLEDEQDAFEPDLDPPLFGRQVEIVIREIL